MSDSYSALQRTFDEAPMRRAQVLAVAIVAMIAAMDGFDVQAMAFVAPVVGKAWLVGRATLGLVLASSLFGMAAGAVILSPLADIVGRRPAVLGGLALISVATLLSGLFTADLGARRQSRSYRPWHRHDGPSDQHACRRILKHTAAVVRRLDHDLRLRVWRPAWRAVGFSGAAGASLELGVLRRRHRRSIAFRPGVRLGCRSRRRIL